MRLRICHTTRFAYDAPAYQSHNQIRMRPLNNAGQVCNDFALEVVPRGATLEFQDYYGNHVVALSIHQPHKLWQIVARSVVDRIDQPATAAASMPLEEFLRDDRKRIAREYDFLSSSPYVVFSDRVKKFFWLARPRADEDVAGYTERLVAFVRDQFHYRPGVTNANSTTDHILTTGAGVCQDFAHLTIAVLRLAGVPARYVSGYLAPPRDLTDEGSNRPQASHAWLEAQLPYQGWTGFDPTHGCHADLRHIRVAIGRDYSDVPPLRGVYRSFGQGQTMSVDLRVEREDTAHAATEAYSHQHQQ